ncbi:DNA-binding transcriptional LysR family regulator [Lipingzhangella halophila]|uniref:DNA-binding transcriptional LysR family regulator n=1 Tax=Lipingzhangella halophila TaxID=1783352 RepID=A0A7W7W6Y5_9ACTN|nr:LysR family transcriptional regulator [Lipingzhangella halophila]MBB4935325.1 DNA-binding transcriptional LysR family regulator [Lipingzhangella halophila]
MNLANLDLNLLVALHALLQERNVTRAAERLGLSQPAMSAALARLRRHFDDELLVRVGNRFELSTLGRELSGQTEMACHVVERVFTAQAGFDPATSQREFTIITSDYPLAVLNPNLSEAMRERAPGVRLRFPQMSTPAVEDIDTTLRSVDGMLMPHGFITDQPAVDLFHDRWVCVAAEDNHSIGDRLTMDDVRRLPWVVTYRRPTSYASAVEQLDMLDIEPHIEVTVEGFLSVPLLVAGSERIALLQERLARKLLPLGGFRILECPFRAAPLVEGFWWHPSHRHDPGHAWLRGFLSDVAKEVGAPRPEDQGTAAPQ